jgi:hypothetical protein
LDQDWQECSHIIVIFQDFNLFQHPTRSKNRGQNDDWVIQMENTELWIAGGYLKDDRERRLLSSWQQSQILDKWESIRNVIAEPFE